MAVIYAGPKRKKFTIHKDLLVAQSDFFKAALCGAFREGETGEVYLPENDPLGLEVLVHKLYRGSLPANFSRVTGGRGYSRALVEYYVLADRILSPPQAKIEALDKLYHTYASHLEQLNTSSIFPDTIAAAWSQTTKDCPMRRLLIDILLVSTAYSHLTLNEMYNTFTKMVEPMDNDERLRFTCELERMTRAMDSRADRITTFKSFRTGVSLADSPRYQIGFLKKTETGVPGAGSEGSGN